ncbi:MAG TPA: PAS domain-containing protein, partial [Pseudomonas sp.]|nr:PAS domain-containing protein [Pseudomonas sp.]
MIFIKDLEGRYRLINPTFERLFHVTADQVIGRDDHQLFPTAIADALQCNDLQVIRQGRSIEVEERILWRDRPYIYLTTKFPIRDASGQVTGVGGIAADISERKRTEEALRHVALGVSRATGYEVFPATVRYLASSLQVDLAFVSRAARPDSSELSTLATWYRGEPVGNFDYPLQGTPCAEVFGRSFLYIPRDLGRLYPLDDLLIHIHIDSYAGFPLFASDGR